MANILVTGGAGYVGSVCCAELLRLGHSVTIADDLSTGFREAIPADAHFAKLDIGDAETLRALTSGSKFDAVFHFAAKAHIPESVSNPGVYFQSNVASAVNMLEGLRAAGIKNFVFSSSAAVYGSPEIVPIDEDAPKQPLNAYGETKLILERILEWYASAYGWSVVAFRYFSAAGATADLGERHEPETHLIPILLQAAAGEREYFEIYGDDYATHDGTCERDFVHVLDIAKAHILALQKMGKPGMRHYNIGAGKGYTVRQVYEEVKRITGRPIPARLAGRRAGDPGVLCASPRKIMKELGWQPEHSSLQEILASAWDWKQKQVGKIAGSPAA